MAEFCETCPLRGECKGEIKQIIVEDMFDKDILRRTNLIGRYVVALDEHNGPSEPIPYSPLYKSSVIPKECEQRINDCQQPKTRLIPFLRPKDCGAFTVEIRPYEATPGINVMSKEDFIAGILAKYVR